MRRRTTTVLLLLAVGIVCVLLWEAVVAPRADGPGASEEGSILDDEALLSSDGAEDEDLAEGPTLAGHGRAPRPGDGGSAADLGSGGRGDGPGGPGASDVRVAFVGRVLGTDGRPAGGVKILMIGANGFETIETDANGAFDHGARPGRYQLYFDGGADGGLLLPSWMLDGGSGADLEFTLREPATVEVRVERAKEPVSGVAVQITSRDLGDAVKQEGTTNLDGVAVFEGLVSARYEVTAQVPDGPSMRQASMFAPPAKTTPVRVRIPDGVVLQGTVRAGESGPGLAAHIVLHTQSSGSAGVFETEFDTAADGSYELFVPQGEPREFLVEAEGFAPWPTPKARGGVIKSLRGLRGKGPVTRDAVLTLGAALSGVVTLEDGTPLPGIALRFAMRRGPTATATTKADGRYEVAQLVPGPYDLQIETPGWFPLRDQTMRVAIPGGTTPAPTAFDIRVNGARRLDGIVVDAAGLGIGGARVWIVGGGRVVRSARDAGRLLEVFTHANGTWGIGDIPPDQNVAVRAAMGELEAAPINVRWENPPPTPLRLELGGTASITGRVVDLDGSAPVRGARIRVVPEPPDGRTGRIVTSDPLGEYAVGRLLPGRWKLVPSARDYLVSEGQSVDVGAEEEASLDLRLDPGVVFAGVVVDAAGRPLPGARVSARGIPDGQEKAVSRAATSDAQGAFRLMGFSPGSYELTVWRRGFILVRLADLRSPERALRIVLRAPTRR